MGKRDGAGEWKEERKKEKERERERERVKVWEGGEGEIFFDRFVLSAVIGSMLEKNAKSLPLDKTGGRLWVIQLLRDAFARQHIVPIKNATLY